MNVFIAFLTVVLLAALAASLVAYVWMAEAGTTRETDVRCGLGDGCESTPTDGDDAMAGSDGDGLWYCEGCRTPEAYAEREAVRLL